MPTVLSPDTPPELLGALHPAWRGDIDALAPWRAAAEGFTSDRIADFPLALVLADCGSTMDEAWQRIAEGGLSAWDSILAARQSGGRGRLRRPWTSPAGNLHVSLALPEPPQPFRNMTSLLVGWCLACALGRQGVCLKLKWPNDLLINDRKVGGALVEERKGRLVTGVGLNLVACPPDEAMRADRAVPAAKLHIPGKGPLRVWLDALPIFREVWMKSQEGSPKDLARRVEGALAWLGGRVGVRDGERVRTGRLLGLDERGGLLLAEDGGTSALYSGSLFPL